MDIRSKCSLAILIPLAFVLAIACNSVTLFPKPTLTPTPFPVAMVSIADIQKNYSSYEGQLIRVRGYGVVMETLPLCPGYVGMDTRLRFISEGDNSIYAVVTASASGAEKSDWLREFQVYVRVFNGEIGCPGSLHTATFPFLEIIGVGQ